MSLVDMSSPNAVHARLCSLARSRCETDYELGRWLLAADRLKVHVALGYASFAQYVEGLFGLSPRQVRERLRVATALESIPELAEALRSGQRSWSVVRELTRVATEDTAEEWNEAASGRTSREVEQLVARHVPGDRPSDAPRAEPPRSLGLQVSAPTWALFEEVRRVITAELGGHADDDALVATLARGYLAGTRDRDDGRASYAIALTVCERCETATQRAGGSEVVVDAATLERARCDARELGRVDSLTPARATQKVPPKIRRAVIARHGGRCAVPGCTHSAFLEIHHPERRADGGTHDPDRLLPLCGAHHKAAHVGTLVIRGSFSSGFRFEHADGSRYGTKSASPARSLVLAQVLEALVSMGFKHSTAQGMVDRAATHVGPDCSRDEALRAALREAPPTPNIRSVREALAPYGLTCPKSSRVAAATGCSTGAVLEEIGGMGEVALRSRFTLDLRNHAGLIEAWRERAGFVGTAASRRSPGAAGRAGASYAR